MFTTIGKLIITDPCYEIGTWCQGTIEVLPGEWKSEVVYDLEDKEDLLKKQHIKILETKEKYNKSLEQLKKNNQNSKIIQLENKIKKLLGILK